MLNGWHTAHLKAADGRAGALASQGPEALSGERFAACYDKGGQR